MKSKKHTCKSSKGKAEIVDVVKYLNKKTKSYCGYCGKELK